MIYRKHRYDANYINILEEVQKKVTEIYYKIIDGDAEKHKELIIKFYIKIINENNYKIYDFITEELAEKLYNDTHSFSVLTQPLNDPEIEGIHVNAWDTILLQFRNGEYQKIDGFETPTHATDIMRRLIQSRGGTLDNAYPLNETSIGSSIRITTFKSPIVDEEIGIACYIRKLSKKPFKRETYLNSNFIDEKELNMLEILMRRGVSILLVGKVNTGKTTFLSYLLSTLPNSMKIVTIENSAREMDLIKKEDGETVNSVIHLLTRDSKNDELDINQDTLIVSSLRANPDYISVAEMRDKEAYIAVEACRSGHPVISTTHANSPISAHKRIADLSRKGTNTDYTTALIQAQEAFPIVAYIHQLEDNSRKVMGISECYVDDENKAHYTSLWSFEIDENIEKDGKILTFGKHQQNGTISTLLIERMKMYGLTQSELKIIKGGN